MICVLVGLVAVVMVACSAPAPLTVQEYAAFRCESDPLLTQAESPKELLDASRSLIENLERIKPPSALRDLHAASLAYERARLSQYEAGGIMKDARGFPSLTPEAQELRKRVQAAAQVVASNPEVMAAWHEGCPEVM